MDEVRRELDVVVVNPALDVLTNRGWRGEHEIHALGELQILETTTVEINDGFSVLTIRGLAQRIAREDVIRACRQDDRFYVIETGLTAAITYSFSDESPAKEFEYTPRITPPWLSEENGKLPSEPELLDFITAQSHYWLTVPQAGLAIRWEREYAETWTDNYSVWSMPQREDWMPGNEDFSVQLDLDLMELLNLRQYEWDTINLMLTEVDWSDRDQDD